MKLRGFSRFTGGPEFQRYSTFCPDWSNRSPPYPRDNAIKLDAMDRNTFREFLHDAFNMTDDILMDRIFKFFDTKSDGTITREEWIMGLNVLLKGTTDEQTTYSFSIYDLNHDGFISK